MASTPKMTTGPLAPGAPGTQVPDWELPPTQEKTPSKFNVFDRSILSSGQSSQRTPPPNANVSRRRRVCDVSARARWWLVILVSVIICTGLSIGLGVGLTRGRKGYEKLPREIERGHSTAQTHTSMATSSLQEIINANIKRNSGSSSSSTSGGENLPLTGQTYSGDLTYYDVGLGACGIDSTPDQLVVAIGHNLFDAHMVDANPNHNPLCGHKIRAHRYYAEVGGERSVDVTVVDRCVGCTDDDLDMSAGAFDMIAPGTGMDRGRRNVTWAWL